MNRHSNTNTLKISALTLAIMSSIHAWASTDQASDKTLSIHVQRTYIPHSSPAPDTTADTTQKNTAQEDTTQESNSQETPAPSAPKDGAQEVSEPASHAQTANAQEVNAQANHAAQPVATQRQNRYQRAHQDQYRDSRHNTLIDSGRDSTKRWLNRTAAYMDNWFGEPDPNRPASANLRFMTDFRYNRYDGETIKPRLRGRLRLPTLEHRLSVMIGDDDLDDEYHNVGHQATNNTNLNNRVFDQKQARKDNSSLALRWSKLVESFSVDTDADVGIRSTDDLYLRLRAEKIWDHGNDLSTRLEQIYRYGIDSKHYLQTNLQVTKYIADDRFVSNHTYVNYLNNKNEEMHWGNSLYQHHTFAAPLGNRTLSYGVYTAGEIESDRATLNIYGPYISYRQPVWRKWLFLQGDLTYYNNKSDNQDHTLGTFIRLEMLF